MAEAALKEGSNSIDISSIEASFESAISAAATSQEVENIRVEYLGKTGILTSQLKTLGKLEPQQRKETGQALNKVKISFTEQIDSKKQQFEAAELNAKLLQEKIDVTIPVQKANFGKIHPITQVLREVTAIFEQMGFTVSEGPEIENDYNNFTALNIDENHPARQMHDTFYVEGEDADKNQLVLRTHTSPVQIRTMKNGKPPFRFIAPGRTFRHDMDQTHSPMFHQIEGFLVEKNINMGHLKGCLQEFLDKFFETDGIKMRFRPSFFPFTEPSAEVDIQCKKGKDSLRIGEGEDFMEILGCGMIHPNVLKNCGVDPEEYSGFAFGIGIERLAMLKYGIPDLRQFFENDIRFLKHYGFDFHR